MGFSIIEARFIESALKMGILPAGISILELGESNIIPEHAAPDLLSALRHTFRRIELPRRRVELPNPAAADRNTKGLSARRGHSITPSSIPRLTRPSISRSGRAGTASISTAQWRCIENSIA
jgi:hypothetical protein